MQVDDGVGVQVRDVFALGDIGRVGGLEVVARVVRAPSRQEVAVSG